MDGLRISLIDFIKSKHELTSTPGKRHHDVTRDYLVTIYKSFIRPHLNHANVIFDKLSNPTFYNWIKRAQYNAALAITGTIPDTSKEKLYQELGFVSVKERR